MNRLLLALGCCTLAIAQGVVAQSGSAPQDAKVSAIAFWRFAQCASEGNSRRINALLAAYPWAKKDFDSARKFAASMQVCLLPNDQLGFRSDVFRGALASTMVAQKYVAGQFPNYSAYPFAFPAKALARYDGDARRQYLSLAFAECVFRTNPAGTVALFKSEPFSKDEKSAFGSLGPAMSACLPLQPGNQVQFSRPALRTFLGVAAYESDKLVAGQPVKQGNH